MSVSSVSPFSPFARLSSGLSIRPTFASSRTSAPSGASQSRLALREIGGLALGLRRALDALGGLTDLRRSGSRPRPAAAPRGDSLNISTSSSATRLGSSEEINVTDTSYGPRDPSFAGESSSSVQVGGTYSGAQGDDTLTFRAVTGGNVGSTLVTFEVLDGGGAVIDSLDFAPNYSPDESVALSNGLEVSLSAGSVDTGDSFTLDVSISVGTSVDPNAAFDGTGASSPRFDPGVEVTAGTFTINGVGISVTADDTIAAVLERISQSAAGVDARYVPESDGIAIVQRTTGASPQIHFGADSSGFLAAVKLSNSNVERGTDDERSLNISEVAALAGISTGDFIVNGQTLSVDVESDSLNDIIDRINQSSVGAVASFSVGQRSFGIRAASVGTNLTVDDGTSGLFSTLGVETGTFAPSTTSARRTRFREPDVLREEFADFSKALNDFFSEDVRPGATVETTSIRSAVKGALRRSITESGLGTSQLEQLGLSVDVGSSDEVIEVKEAVFRDALRSDAQSIANFLAADGGGGLLDQLEKAFDSIAETLGEGLGRQARGLIVDLRA